MWKNTGNIMTYEIYWGRETWQMVCVRGGGEIGRWEKGRNSNKKVVRSKCYPKVNQ